MFLFTKQPGRRTQVRFMPGCLVVAVVLSIALTIMVNVIFRIL
jgi:hypothetical protein